MMLIIIFLSLLRFSTQKSTPEDTSYVAAVVEYQVQTNQTINLQNYLRLIQNASTQNADIVIFPEMTLTRRYSIAIPIYGMLKQYPIPALHPELYDEVLVSISLAARRNQIYVVINIQEVMDCTNETSSGENCPERKQYFFNTNVVFDRSGSVIDRYRKINLYGELSRSPALKPDLGLFTTDFGVTFGHFICFDLMFQVPAIQVVEKTNITDVIFTTMWFSEMPYLTAVEIQQAYAHTMNVNFLTAGANNVRVGSSGSGIFSGKAGALISLMTGVPTTKLLVARVPKVPGQVQGSYPGPIYDDPLDQDNLFLKTDQSLLSHVSRLLKKGFQEFELTDKNVTCYFRVRLSERNGTTAPFYRAFVHDGTNVYSNRHLGTVSCLIDACKTQDRKSCNYRYRALAFSGVRSFDGVATGGAKVCSIVACTGDTIDSCGKRFKTFSPNTTGLFDELSITARVPTPVTNIDLNAKNTVYFPVSLDITIMPLKSEDKIYRKSSAPNNIALYELNLKNINAELYAFGIWGREYTTDGQEASPPRPDSENTNGSSYVHKLNNLLLMFSNVYFLRK